MIMNKKNSLIIAIVLLLLIGTGSFVFAGTPEQKIEEGNNKTNNNKNNLNNEKDKTENDTPSIKEPVDDPDENNSGTLLPDESFSSNPDESTNVKIPIYNGGNSGNGSNNNNQGNNSGNSQKPPVNPDKPGENTDKPSVNPDEPGEDTEKPPVNPDDSDNYEKVLEAIKQAEKTLDENDIKKAEELLATLKDSEEKKNLANRLEIIKTEKNLTERVALLEQAIQKATNKEELNKVKDLDNVDELKTQISSLPNSFAKDNLIQKIEKITQILSDNEAPIISGITNDTFTNQSVTISIDDENAILKLNNNVITLEALNAMTENKVNQTYVITAIDQSFNESRLIFTIDTEIPTAEIEYNKDLTTKTNQEIIATLKNASEKIIIINNEGKENYTFTENGEFIFEFKDLAGNIGHCIAQVSNIDKIVPSYQKLGILNQSRLNTTERLDIANLNDTIQVYVIFDEPLAKLPTVSVNGHDVEAMLEENSAENTYKYVANYQVSQDTKEDFIDIKIKDYADEAGNSGIELTNDNINVEEHKRVYVIVEPGLELIPGGYFNTKVITIKDPDFAYMTIQKAFQKVPTKVDINTYEIPSVGTYTITVYDKNDNIISSAKMAYDGSAPEVESEGINGTVKEHIDPNNIEVKEYEKVTLQILDASLKIIQNVDEEGNVLNVYKEYNPIKPNQRYTLEITESGNYIIETIDAAGNKTTIRFKIK